MQALIVIPLILTLLVCVGVGFVVNNIIGFWEGFVATLILQFVVYNLYRITKKEPQTNEAQEMLQTLIDLQTIPVACPCGKNVFEDQVYLNTENIFTCDKCNSKFAVILTPDTVLQTEQANLENIFLQLKEKAAEKELQ